MASDRRYPTEVLKAKILSEPLDVKTYQADGGNFSITAITPVLIGKMQAQTDMMLKSDSKMLQQIRSDFKDLDASRDERQ